MKLSFASFFFFGLSLLGAAVNAGDVRVRINGGAPFNYWPLDAQMSTIETWYGYNVTDAASANTPEGIEDINRNDISILAVNVEGGGTSVAWIIDTPLRRPDDTTSNSVRTTITCVGNCGGQYPTRDWFAVKDDAGDVNNRFTVTPGTPPNPDIISIRHAWAPCCTDGAATVPMTGHFEICLQFDVIVWDTIDNSVDGIFMYNALDRVKLEDIPAEGTSSSTICIEHGAGGVTGDPHFELWNGKMYDFMGACDMVLVKAKSFADNQDLQIHIRTTIRQEYSFVETAVVKIGEDTLEVTGFGGYSLNGVMDAKLPETVGGFNVTHTQVSKKVHEFGIHLGKDEKIVLKTVKDMVAVKLDEVNANRLLGSSGMLGNYKSGKMISRNGTVVIEDPIEFAMDWQVREGEGTLFQTHRSPQHPAKCTLPTLTADVRRRRLGETITWEAAEKACAGWHPHFRTACVSDVMSTGDLEIASAGY